MNVQNSNDKHFATFLRLMTESLLVIHYYRAKYLHMPGIYAIHFRVYPMTERKSEVFINRKRISYDQWQNAPNCTSSSERQFVVYIIS